MHIVWNGRFQQHNVVALHPMVIDKCLSNGIRCWNIPGFTCTVVSFINRSTILYFDIKSTERSGKMTEWRIYSIQPHLSYLSVTFQFTKWQTVLLWYIKIVDHTHHFVDKIQNHIKFEFFSIFSSGVFKIKTMNIVFIRPDFFSLLKNDFKIG